MIWTLDFWKGASERAIKTFFQTLVASIGVTTAGLGGVDWPTVLSVAGLAAVLSVATSIGNAGAVAGDQALPRRAEAEPGEAAGSGDVGVGYVVPASTLEPEFDPSLVVRA